MSDIVDVISNETKQEETKEEVKQPMQNHSKRINSNTSKAKQGRKKKLFLTLLWLINLLKKL